MAFGNPVSDNDAGYFIELQHASGIRLTVTAAMPLYIDGTVPPEQTRDDIIQAFVSILATIPDTVVASASKRGTFHQSITP